MQQVNQAVELPDAYVLLRGDAIPGGTDGLLPPLWRRAGWTFNPFEANPAHPPTTTPTATPVPPPIPTPTSIPTTTLPTRKRSPRRAPSPALVTPLGVITTQKREKWSVEQTEELIGLRALCLTYVQVGDAIGKTVDQCRQKVKYLSRKLRYIYLCAFIPKV